MDPVFLEGKSLPIFPCRWDKKPATQNGFKDATSDPKLIGARWGHHHDVLVGVPTGAASGLAVIDVDPRRGGREWLAAAAQNLPETRVHATKSGGWHLLYRHPPRLGCSPDRIAPGVDVKAESGYVIWWPAVGGQVLYDAPVAEFPAWLLTELLNAPRHGSRSLPPFASSGDDRRAGIAPSFAGSEKEGNGPPVREAELPKALYFKMLELVPLSASVSRRDQRRVIGLLRTVTQKNMNRNDALNWAAFSFRELIEAGIVSREAAECLLLEAATLNGYVAKDGQCDAIATIRSGLGISGPSLSFTERHEPDEGTG